MPHARGFTSPACAIPGPGKQPFTGQVTTILWESPGKLAGLESQNSGIALEQGHVQVGLGWLWELFQLHGKEFLLVHRWSLGFGLWPSSLSCHWEESGAVLLPPELSSLLEMLCFNKKLIKILHLNGASTTIPWGSVWSEGARNERNRPNIEATHRLRGFIFQTVI